MPGQADGDLAVIEHVEEQSLSDVFLVMGERDREYIVGLGDLQQSASTFPAAKKTPVSEIPDPGGDLRAMIMKGQTEVFDELLYGFGVPARELGIDVGGVDLPALAISLIVENKHVQERVTVLPPRDADQDPAVLLQQLVFFDRPTQKCKMRLKTIAAGVRFDDFYRRTVNCLIATPFLVSRR